MESVGQKIKDLRRRLKLTQADLAGQDFTKSFISQIEKGQTNPSLKSLTIIAQRLGIPVSVLLGETETNSDTQNFLPILENARIARSNGQLSEAAELYLHAAQVCPDSDHAALGFIYMLLSEIREEQQLPNKTIEHLELAVEHLDLSHDFFNLARALNLLAVQYSRAYRHREAYSTYVKALSLFEAGKLADRYLEIQILVNLGTTFCDLHRYHECIETLESSINLMRAQDNYHNFGKVCQLLGYAYAAIGEISTAIKYTKQAIHLYSGLEQWNYATSSLINLGFFYFQLGELGQARQAYESIISADWPVDIADTAAAHIGIAAILISKSKYQEAIDRLATVVNLAPLGDNMTDWLEQVARCAEHVPIPQHIMLKVNQLPEKWNGEPGFLANVHSLLGKIYDTIGDIDKANVHLRESVAIYSSIHRFPRADDPR